MGHIWLIRAAAKLFDRVVVALAINPEKRPTFAQQDRVEMLKQALAEVPNAEVEILSNEFLVDFAKRHKAKALIRGIRNSMDFEYEKTMAHANRKGAPEIETVFIMPPKELEDVSSSFVRGLMGPAGWRKWVKPLVPPGVYARMKAAFLQKRWTKLSDALGLPAAVAQAQFKALVAAYNDPTRAYHTLDHLIDCFEQLDKLLTTPDAPQPQSPAMLELALWFHDLVDERNNPQAVAQSAEAAVSFARQGSQVTPDQQALLRTNILATRHSLPPEPDRPLDAQLMSDIDLSILGQSAASYRQYAQQIAQEYSLIASPEAYRAGRGKFLEGFLQRDRLYQTDWFHQRLNQKARANLKREQASLKQA
jgi:pantetheine-phosphate adenylyltransferase